MKTVAIIQARMSSTRLPGKVMLELGGKPVIEQVVDRTKHADTVSEVWLATTDQHEDDVLANWARSKGFPFFRGSKYDVLDRYVQTAKLAKADVIVRVTADCPLIDPAITDLVVNEFFSGSFDYANNVYPQTYPDGLDTGVFSFAALEKSAREARLKSEREHVDPYVKKHPEIFRTKHVAHNKDLSSLRWTLDYPEDYKFLSLVFKECQRRNVFGHLEEVLQILNDNPEWLKINDGHIFGEGYIKSVKEDGIFE